MADSYFQLYKLASSPSEAFLLNEGSVYFFVTDADKYMLKGNNLILGATELILGSLLGTPSQRIETALAEAGAKVKKIPADKFLSSMNNYSVIANVSMVIAKQVLLTNQIINKNFGSLGGEEKKVRDISIEYFRIVSRLKKEYAKRKFPWLNALIDKYENSLLCKRGESFDRSAEPMRISSPIALSDTTLQYEKDTVICEEGSIGDEMYILQSGSIDVYIGDNRITTISDQGYVFGEMALFLGEKRSATLKARNNVVLTRLRKDDLREIAAKHGDVLLSILTSLAKKHFYNTEKIVSINNLIIEKRLSAGQADPQKKHIDTNRSATELLSLKKDVENLYISRNAEFLKDVVEGF